MDVPTNHVFSVRRLKAGRRSGSGKAGKAALRYETEIKVENFQFSSI
jgi:hypothetical protein